MTPFLALPSLVAYLRQQGREVKQIDASRDFFLDHLLKPQQLEGLLRKIRDRSMRGGLTGKSGELDRDMVYREGLWLERIGRVQEDVEALRDAQGFFDPVRCVRAQTNLYMLLRLASLAWFPTSFTFNTFQNPELEGYDGLLRFCEDRQVNPFLEFYEHVVPSWLGEEPPLLVGISVSTSYQVAGAFTLARFLKRRFPDIHVTLGGRHILRLKEALSMEPGYLLQFADTLILQDGERPLEELLGRLEAGRSWQDVPNLVFCRGGALVENPVCPHEPLSGLPAPDFSDLRLSEYLAPTPILPVRFSEGCYWGKCTFCSRYDNRRFMTVPPERAAAQLAELMHRYRASCFTVNDDCLTPTYLESVARGIVARGLRPQISLWCKPVGSFTRERLRLLAEAGVRLVRWGLETGHPRILKLMNKGTNLADTLAVTGNASEAGIWNHATVIFGFPGETDAEARETLHFLERNVERIHSSIFFRFVLLSHSHIMRNPDRFGISEIKEAPNAFAYEHPFTCPDGMDAGTLDAFLRRAQDYRLKEMYGHPFWYYLRIREYLLLHVARHGLETVLDWKVRPDDLSVYRKGSRLEYFFRRPADVAPENLTAIRSLIEMGGAVGLSWVGKNLAGAHLIGYAVEEGRVVGTMTHKRPLEEYRRRIEAKTGLDLEGYLERGYSVVRPEYRSLGVGDRLLKGLVEGSRGWKVYVTIRMDNLPALRLTARNGMRFAASYTNERTGHEVGVFVSG